jgi:catechol 2,3-dioxygenase-like lactoylglutathione lyase family enzyme
MQAGAILETALYAHDLDAAEDFYSRVLGLPVIRRLEGKFVFFRCGPAVVLVFNPLESARPDARNPIPRHGATGPGHLCLRAEDRARIEAWQAHLAACGVAIEARHEWPGGGVSIYFRDPAGNSLEFAEPCIWGEDFAVG